MTSYEYDAIIVGARIAGSTLAMLLADRGWRVLLLDRATFPSDTLSTHAVFTDTFAIWDQLGVMDDVEALGVARLTWLRRWAGETIINGKFLPHGGRDYALNIRRVLLDEVLVRHSGRRPLVDLRTGTNAEALLWERGRVVGVRARPRGVGQSAFEACAQVVIGADGRLSWMARELGAAYYNLVPPLYFAFYAYWEGVEPFPSGGTILETYDSVPARATLMVMPADGPLWTLVTFAPQEQYEEFSRDREATYEARLRAEPEFGPRLRDARRVSPVRGRGDFANYFRHSHGPGWALVGDAGSFKDAITGQGIGDAVRSCVILAEALERAFCDEEPLASALAWYQRERDLDLLPNYIRITRGAPEGVSKEDYQRFLVCVATSQELSDRFVSVVSHAVPPEEFFTPEHIRKVLAEIGPRALRDERVLAQLGRLGR